MPNDPYYSTHEWRMLCAVARKRSGGVCEAPGCTEPGKVVDHIKSRKQGGLNHPDNLRHLCRTHDNQVKEDANGKRNSDGKFKLIGCDVDGWPIAQPTG